MERLGSVRLWEGLSSEENVCTGEFPTTCMHTHSSAHTHKTHKTQLVTFTRTPYTYACTHAHTYHLHTYLAPFPPCFLPSAQMARWHSSVASSPGGVASQIGAEDVHWGGGVAGGGLCRQATPGQQWSAEQGKRKEGVWQEVWQGCVSDAILCGCHTIM